MENKYKFKNLDLVNTSFLFLTPIAAIVMTTYWLNTQEFHQGVIWLAMAFWILSGMSITAGYHRLFSHRAYDSNRIMKFLFLIFGAAAFQNSVLKWCSDHRIHHNRVDTSEDPYNINEGFFFAHMGWVLLKGKTDFNYDRVKDLAKDPLIMWQHKNYLAISIFVGIFLPAIISFFLFDSFIGGLAVAGFCKIVFVHHTTFLINSLCHCVGSTPYTDSNTAKDSWIMALFTFGEGYHNFHHFFQTDYRNGVRWYHFDPAKWLIKFLESFGWASKLKKTSDEKILKAKMQMRLKNVDYSWFSEEKIAEFERLKEKFIDSMHSFEDLRRQFRAAKKSSVDNLNEIKAKMLEAKAEMKASWQECKEMMRTFELIAVA